MTASKNQYMQEAVETMYRLSQDEKIRLQCEARERYYRDQRTTLHKMEEKDAAIREMSVTIQEMGTEITQLRASMDAEIQQKDAEIAQLRAALKKSKVK